MNQARIECVRPVMRFLIAVASLAILFGPAASFAHEGQEHVMGTVKSIDGKSITVTAKGGKEVAVQLDAATKFEKSGAAATAKDVAAGDRVVVHARRAEGGLTATLVKVGRAMPAREHHGKRYNGQ